MGAPGLSLYWQQYKGALACLNDASNAVGMDAVEDDQDEEMESYRSALESDEQLGVSTLEFRLACTSAMAEIDPAEVEESEAAESKPPSLPVPDDEVAKPASHEKVGVAATSRAAELAKLHDNLKEASKNIVTNNTLKEYTRLWSSFNDFCMKLGFISKREELQEDPQDRHLPADLPAWVSLWIMNKCDDLDISTGTRKDLKITRATYGTAQKMRAAITHTYGRDFGLGTQIWTEDPLFPNKFRGNPSLSTVVSQYMISLRRRKVRAGEVVTSARAIDEATIKKIWLFNEMFPLDASRQQISRKWKDEHPEYWGGRYTRVMTHWLDVSSFLCLLRFDEALHIQWHHVSVEDLGSGKFKIRIELPFRKTHQNGGCAPFVLYTNRDRPWLCPIRAFALWSETCRQLGIPREGYMFRKRVGFDNFSADPGDAMSSDAFLECFRNNLLDVGVDPRPYGTHSFRRGGCQYLAMVLRWPIRNICTWGGWSENFNSGTIFKYLLSWTDAPLIDREDYMNPDRQAGETCPACGRSCLCA